MRLKPSPVTTLKPLHLQKQISLYVHTVGCKSIPIRIPIPTPTPPFVPPGRDPDWTRFKPLSLPRTCLARPAFPIPMRIAFGALGSRVSALRWELKVSVQSTTPEDLPKLHTTYPFPPTISFCRQAKIYWADEFFCTQYVAVFGLFLPSFLVYTTLPTDISKL